MLHAAAFQKDIESVGLLSPFLSYADIATTKLYKPAYIPHTVSGAIQKYDLPDLMASLCPRKLLILNPNSGDGVSLNLTSAQKSMEFPLKVYKHKKVLKNIKVLNNVENSEEVLRKIISYL